MFAPRYFPVFYFAARYWPPGAGESRVILTTLSGRAITIFTADILAVEEQLAQVKDEVYNGVRSKIFLADHEIIVRSTKAAVITAIQAVEDWASTIITTTLPGREIEARSTSIQAVEEQLTVVKDAVYTGVRSKIFLENHQIVLRATKAAVITLIQAVEAWASTIIMTTIEGREHEARAARIAAVEEMLADIRSAVYTGVRSRTYLEAHLVEVRLTASAVVTLIDAA